MLFANPGEYEPCGLFSAGHFKLIIITIILVIIALKNTVKKSKKEIKQIIKKCTILVLFLEVIIINFKLKTGNIRNVNNYIPLYFCSILLYAGALASFAKGKLKRVGEVFLATGGVIGGLVFLVMPTTSLPRYPMLHIVSLHSFLFHGIMIYLGVLINVTNYITIDHTDIKYYASIVGVICLFAYILNNIFDSNLMFISKDFPGTPIEWLYKTTGKLFTPMAILTQMTLPFYTVLGIKTLINKRNKCEADTSIEEFSGGIHG